MNRVPSRLGILGGGQLARMLAVAAQGLGVLPVVFAEKKSDCAFQVVSEFTVDDGTDPALEHFLSRLDAVTIENEFFDLARLERCLGRAPVPLVPSLESLKRVQDKLNQKRILSEKGLPTLPFVEILSADDLKKASKTFGGSLVIKKAKMGYDGKGTFIFAKGDFDPAAFHAQYPDFTGYAEPFARFEKELAAVIARAASGETAAFPLAETNQEGGICRWAVAPARVSKNVSEAAIRVGREVIEAFGGTGVFGIEMFQVAEATGYGANGIVVNEIAPRVHNSGHWTMNGCRTSQFEQHVRAVTGQPLGAVDLLAPSAMVNILGAAGSSDIKENSPIKFEGSGEKDTWIHWYGKTGKASGRKLGHVNATAANVDDALAKARRLRDALKI